jgi:tRNA (Thr-GGU) A37 N-methylase
MPFRERTSTASSLHPHVERTGSVLRVEGLDAFDGSPVIDIKPYVAYFDSVADAKVPEWVSRLGQLLGLIGGSPETPPR